MTYPLSEIIKYKALLKNIVLLLNETVCKIYEIPLTFIYWKMNVSQNASRDFYHKTDSLTCFRFCQPFFSNV